MGGLHQPFKLLLVADVAGDGDGLAAAALGFGADLRRRLFALVQLAAGDDHLGTMLRQPFGHGAAHALGRSGQQRHLAGQVKEIGCNGHRLAPLLRIMSPRSPTQATASANQKIHRLMAKPVRKASNRSPACPAT